MADMITIVFEEELSVLRLQARSIDLYCKDVGNIYVVVNDRDDVANQISRAWWGQYADRVIILPRSVFSTTYVDNGWLSQQVIKLMTAAVSYNKWSVVLDAKTLFVKPFNFDSKPVVGSLEVYPVFEPSRQIVNQLFNINLTEQLGPGGVPFIFHNQTVRAMIAEVETLTQQSFPKWFQSQGMLTEFLLYSGYLYYRDKDFSKLYNSTRCDLDVVNICHSEVESFDRLFKQMCCPTTATVSIHRNAWTKLTTQQQEKYTDLLASKGIQ